VKALPCVIVLCRPEESRNVGSVCRAMKNMACGDLRIVANKEDFSEEQVRTLAVHAFDVWERARFFEPTAKGLMEATADCTIAAGTTRRMGQKRKSWGMTPEQFAVNVRDSGARKIAVVFGNERTGLTDEELDCCSVAINIPSSDDFPSLNLSHAVQVVTYALYRAFDGQHRGYEPGNRERLAKAISSISEDINRLGLFHLAGRRDNDLFLEGIFARAALSEREAQRLEKLFKKISYVRIESAQDK
jgi:tRNA/rRNA methyltransferase